MKALTLDDMELFARVAALGSLSAVARERNVPVSQVSRALARIEQSCGARLVHRSTHGLSLADEGHRFLAYSHRIGAALEELQAEFDQGKEKASGLVRVAASTALAHTCLVPSLAALAQRHPHLRIDVLASDALADLARDGVDIALRTSRHPAPTTVARRIGMLSRALYASPDYLTTAGIPDLPAQLAAYRLITNSSATHLNRWPFMVNGQSIEWLADGRWRGSDTQTVVALALQGLGIARLATVVAAPLVQQGRLVPVLAPLVDLQPTPIYAITLSARHRLPKIRACIDHWVEWFAHAAAP
ncbi:LysR family transcriptional regulator [Ottowia sp.]|uniref:LysR family transcriptional regulator n=1 Tax=Ottowia sp. TaxID=1898956 RepID=UPI002BC60582|nr:LysR family transcriptional regulator [Ottowia sp.]HOB66347.1 LysR family transcriptional regulator [Ottowia sp.]HQD47383.1 LysR family transcriptional regulator [Ottowia sp.]